MLKPRFLNSTLKFVKVCFWGKFAQFKTNKRKMIFVLDNSKYWPELESQW